MMKDGDAGKSLVQTEEHVPVQVGKLGRCENERGSSVMSSSPSRTAIEYLC